MLLSRLSIRFAVLNLFALGALASGATAQSSPAPSLTTTEEKALRGVSVPENDTVSWKRLGKLNLTFSQVELINWAAGGQSSYSLNARFDRTWEHDRNKLGWDSELHGAFGIQSRREDAVTVKTNDRIEFASKIGYRATPQGFATMMASFRSQLAPGYALADGIPDRNQLQSDWMAPGYGVVAWGMDFKANERSISCFLAPVTYKSTWVLNNGLSNAGAFGVTPGERIRTEIGGYIKASWKKVFNDNVTYAGRVDLFSNYRDNPQNIDLFTDHTLTLKATELLVTTISATFIYDDDIALQKDDPVLGPDGSVIDPKTGPGLQVREVLSVGFSLMF